MDTAHHIAIEEWDLANDAVVPGWEVIEQIASQEEAFGGRVLTFEPHLEQCYRAREVLTRGLAEVARRGLRRDALLAFLKPTDRSLKAVQEHYRRDSNVHLSCRSHLELPGWARLEGAGELLRRWERILIANHDGDPVWIVELITNNGSRWHMGQ